jgi:hypothetical protein
MMSECLLRGWSKSDAKEAATIGNTLSSTAGSICRTNRAEAKVSVAYQCRRGGQGSSDRAEGQNREKGPHNEVSS